MPKSVVLRFSDPYEHQRAVRSGNVKFVVAAAGDYRAELTRIDFHRLWMQRSQDSLPRLGYSAIDTDRAPIFFLSDSQQPPLLFGGKDLPPDDMVFFAPGAEHHQRSSSECRWGAMSLTHEDLAAAGRAIVGYDLTAPTATHRIRPSPHLLSRLQHLHAAAGHLAATVPDILTHPEVARAIEQKLVGAMVRCLTEGQVIRDKAPRHRRLPVMRRFEEILNESADTPLYVTEIVSAIGVSERTLRLYCLEHLGMAPHRYLWLRRMNQARRALSLADPQSATVTTIATNYGFWELGRFAGEYRRLFGEPPSTTLRRPPDALRT